MDNSTNIGINEKGHLTIAGVDTTELAKEHATPLFVIDEQYVRNAMSLYRDSIDTYYNGKGLVCYASKALSCKQMYRIAKDENIGIDAVSIGEIHTALAVDFDAGKICYHGNNKTQPELEYAVKHNIGRIVIDNFNEIEMLNKVAEEQGKIQTVHLRLSPGIDAHTHDFIKTGCIDSKFGFAIELGTALKAVEHTIKQPNLKLVGVHCHIGSQIFDLEPFEHAAEVMLGFIAEAKEKTGAVISELNLGGGFGVRYTEKDDPKPFDYYMKNVSSVVASKCKELGLDMPFIIIEPGRSIVANAGITLYTVGGVKDIENVRTYVSIDGGMTDNIRYALYQSEYEFVIANKADKPKDKTVAIAGRCCESGDLLAKSASLQTCEAGDILATLVTGAYNYSMSNNYNRVLKPAVVFVNEGKSYVGVSRETLDDIIRNDV